MGNFETTENIKTWPERQWKPKDITG